jgi:hypothetical protein
LQNKYNTKACAGEQPPQDKHTENHYGTCSLIQTKGPIQQTSQTSQKWGTGFYSKSSKPATSKPHPATTKQQATGLTSKAERSKQQPATSKPHPATSQTTSKLGNTMYLPGEQGKK